MIQNKYRYHRFFFFNDNFISTMILRIMHIGFMVLKFNLNDGNAIVPNHNMYVLYFQNLPIKEREKRPSEMQKIYIHAN